MNTSIKNTEPTVDKDQCFYPLNTISICRKQLLEYALSSKDWENFSDGGKYYFLQIPVPMNLIDHDPLISKIYQVLDIKYPPRIFKMPKKTYYTLHKDGYRGVAINLLLNDSADSVTFYHCGTFRPAQINIEVLNYEQDRYYLLNTQIKHAVVNYSNEDRFMLSLGWGRGEYNRDDATKDIDYYSIYKKKFSDLGL